MNALQERTITNLKTRLTDIYKDRLDQIFLFGSQARGTVEENSDFDILVVLKGAIDPNTERLRTLDIVSELAKIFSLSLRLFGNIYAGEVLLVMIFGALAFALPSLWMSLSLFFGIIQAIVFGALAAAYYASSVPDDESVT